MWRINYFYTNSYQKYYSKATDKMSKCLFGTIQTTLTSIFDKDSQIGLNEMKRKIYTKNPEIFWDISDVDYHPHIQPNKVRTKIEENQGIKNESDQVAIRKGD